MKFDNFRSHHENYLLLAIIVSHIILSAFYSFAIPIFESYDESGHFAYARYIAINKLLPPPLSPGKPSAMPVVSDESTAPPGYYLFAALPLLFVDLSDNLQPQITAGGATRVVPDYQNDVFPYQKTSLGLRLVRLSSIVLGTIAVLLTYLTAKIIFPANPRIRLMAVAIHAWWPQFLMMNGTVTNDVGVALCASLAYWLAAQLWVRRNTNSLKTAVQMCYGLFAVVCALGLVFKGNGASLILFSFAFMGLLWLNNRQAQRTANCKIPFAEVHRGELIFGGMWVIMTLMAWVFALGTLQRVFYRLFINVSTGESVFSSNYTSLQTIWQHVSTGFSLSLLNWSATFKGFFAAFSWGGLGFANDWYRVALFGISLGFIGLFWAFRHKTMRDWLGVSALFFFAFYVVGLVWLMRYATTAEEFAEVPGRYLVPGLGSVCIVLAIGLQSLPNQVRNLYITCVLGGLALTAIAAPFTLFIPTYRPVQLIAVPNHINIQHRSTLQFGDEIRLLGYDIAPQSHAFLMRDRSCKTITLYWQAMRDIKNDYGLLLEFSSPTSSVLLKLVTPSHGTFPTSRWKMGDAFAETYCVNDLWQQTNANRSANDSYISIAWVPYDSSKPSRTLRSGMITLPTFCDDRVPCPAKILAN
jgi:hypothetical protein